ncbi:MMPL family transporter [Nocardioides lijunqiniae]|uniref:MMPL family transporter n=1 Tax=Nocardioides lijunqiniae TaxID=2760832 RepID=UPI001877643D|nr:MMPL family transporter [Nocardioides lijunqiniae]
MITRLATTCLRHRRRVLAAWAVVVVLGLALSPGLFDRLSSEAGSVDGTESDRASQLLRAADPQGPEVVAVLDDVPATSPATRAAVERLGSRVAAIEGVEEVLTPWTGLPAGAGPHAEAVGVDGRAVAVSVRVEPTETGWEALDEVESVLRAADAPTVLVGGETLMDSEMDEQAAADLARAELISLPVLLVLLLVLFGGVVAAGLPLVVAATGIAGTLGTLTLLSLVTDVSVYAVNIVTMLGLGLAVDYALLVVSRFREERAAGLDLETAVVATMATAGRTVAFSAATVSAALASLLVFPDDFLRSMGLACLAVVVLDVVAALTLLPALLGVAGHRVRPAPPSRHDRGAFVRLSRLVTRRPLAIALVSAALLAVAAVPFAGARFSEPDERSLPASSESRAVAELASAQFPDSLAEQVTVVAQEEWSEAELAGYVRRLQELPGVADVQPADAPHLTAVRLVPEAGGDEAARAAGIVDAVRSMEAPTPVLVTGDAAELDDYREAIVSRLPWALLVLVLATFVLLYAFTGSVVVPLKALVMNTLSLGATFGALVWVFQEGHLGALVGTEALGSLSITTPVLVFAIAFGLSMDYEVFLLGRIAEEWRATGDNDRAVVVGLQATGRIVTAAALLMVVVFGAFVAGGFSPVKQVGFGLALAVAVDATVVRMLLVPAVMTLMGRANWWSPSWLARPRVAAPAPCPGSAAPAGRARP